jgi:hypothetical protein
LQLACHGGQTLAAEAAVIDCGAVGNGAKPFVKPLDS